MEWILKKCGGSNENVTENCIFKIAYIVLLNNSLVCTLE
jgi:hypothetical protein